VRKKAVLEVGRRVRSSSLRNGLRVILGRLLAKDTGGRRL
jgi:hypothetical protein